MDTRQWDSLSALRHWLRSTLPTLTSVNPFSVASASQQYVQIPYVNLAQQSFTLQLWIYPTITNTSGEMGIFGQCDSSSICFSLSLRNARVGVSFDSKNNNSSPLLGSTLITGNVWTHLTVVYDAVLRQQQIYVNGGVDAVSNGLVSPYRGSSSGSVTTIGRSAMVSSGFAYFDGWESFFFWDDLRGEMLAGAMLTFAAFICRRIDHVTVSAGSARSACQILNDATLIAYYPLDTTATANDYSVSLSNGIASGTTAVSTGRIGQAISFPLVTSYFQAQCFSSLRNFNPAFTATLWINPNCDDQWWIACACVRCFDWWWQLLWSLGIYCRRGAGHAVHGF